MPKQYKTNTNKIKKKYKTNIKHDTCRTDTKQIQNKNNKKYKKNTKKYKKNTTKY